MGAFFQGITAFITDNIMYINIVGAAALVLIGALFLVPSEKIHDFAKRWLGYAVIGIALALCASNIVNEYVSKFTF